MSSPCVDCKYHETFVDDMGDYFEDDGCICHHDKADSKEYGDYHLNCCYEYGGKLDKCPYYEEVMNS